MTRKLFLVSILRRALVASVQRHCSQSSWAVGMAVLSVGSAAPRVCGGSVVQEIMYSRAGMEGCFVAGGDTSGRQGVEAVFRMWSYSELGVDI